MRLQSLKGRSHEEEEDNQVLARIRERAVRMVLDNRGEHPSLWAAIESIAPKIGCVVLTLLGRVELSNDEHAGPLRHAPRHITTAEHNRVKALEREVKELRRANESLKLARAFQVKLRWRLFSCRRSSTASASGPNPFEKHCKLPVSSLA